MKTPNNMLLIIGEESLQRELDKVISGKFESFRVSGDIDGVVITLLIKPLAVLIDSDSPQVRGTKLYQAVIKHESFQSIPILVASKAGQVHEEIENLPNFKGLLRRPLDSDEVKSRFSALDGEILSIPQPSEQEIESSQAPTTKGKESSEVKILSVDDSSVVRKLVSMILTAEGFKVTTAADGLEGINKAKEILPDLILLDFVMPRMNGFQVCRVLQNDEKLKHIPILLVTSKGEKVGDKFVNQLGVTGFITKPFQPEDLIGKIRQILEARDARKLMQTGAEAQMVTPSLAGEGLEAPSILEPGIPSQLSGNEGRLGEVPIVSGSSQNMKTLIQEELNKLLAGEDFESRVGKVVESKFSKLFQEKIMKLIEKHVERLIQDKIKVVQDRVDKVIEYIKKSKQ